MIIFMAITVAYQLHDHNNSNVSAAHFYLIALIFVYGANTTYLNYREACHITAVSFIIKPAEKEGENTSLAYPIIYGRSR